MRLLRLLVGELMEMIGNQQTQARQFHNTFDSNLLCFLDPSTSQAFHLRVVTYVPGHLFESCHPAPLPLVEKLGVYLGMVDRALQDLTPHEYDSVYNHWDLAHAAHVVKENIHYLLELKQPPSSSSVSPHLQQESRSNHVESQVNSQKSNADDEKTTSTAPHKRHNSDSSQQQRYQLVQGFLEFYEKHIAPVIATLRKSVCHNDANDQNVRTRLLDVC